MKNIIIIIISLATLMVYNQAVSQNNCELDVIGPIRTADYEINDTLPDLPPPAPDTVAEVVDEYRMLYFIHGLNGSNESWSEAAAAVDKKNDMFNFPGYKVDVCIPNYREAQTGLEPAVTSVENQVRDCNFSNLVADYDPTRGIAIAHSQGGIVARALDMKWSAKNNTGEFTYGHRRRFGGIVTVATPNRGAQILNNEDYLRGIVYDLADNLTAGPAEEFRSSDNFFVRLIAKRIELNELRKSFVEFIGNDVGSFLLAENMPEITDEYTVPSDSGKGLKSRIEELNEYGPLFYDQDQDREVQTRKVAFYAVGDLIKKYQDRPIREIIGWQSNPWISTPIWEDRNVPEIIVPISWGTIHYQLNSPNGEPVFEADDADYLTAYKAHQTKHFYGSQELLNEIKRKTHSEAQQAAAWDWDPIAYRHHRKRKNRAEKRRDAWSLGVVFLSKFDELYRIVIGARYAETVTHTSPNAIVDCKCYLPNGDEITYDCVMMEVYYPEATDCEEIYAGSQTVTYIVWHNKDSDGVVLVESQRDIEQNTNPPVKLDGVTHMQVRNSSHTAEMMKTVFEGGVGNFFITPRIED